MTTINLVVEEQYRSRSRPDEEHSFPSHGFQISRRCEAYRCFAVCGPAHEHFVNLGPFAERVVASPWPAEPGPCPRVSATRPSVGAMAGTGQSMENWGHVAR